ncbi:pentatricopeptide repeat-containing protein At5g12100, mitochondrial-like [Salvia miltiorrhiza]|uniref:pentatricopeptide repeat-containing protein At5g12100, mitochondrial-like n=1 Tax=Salvia miltiorrhiza TaxID=226208 RepID=UPI0025AB8A5E|nr:pentatricopeptide repeat-containing protein At5g12100, mitochondrial-like [Salvia miltiorrhiza]
MKAKGVSPVVQTFNILINGYGRVCQFEKCLEILDEMESNGLKPNVVTYGSLINSFCKKGRLLKAEVMLKDMLNRGVLPNAQIYNMLISGHCMGRNTENDFKVFHEMLRSGVSPTNVAYKSIGNALLECLLKLSPDVITFNSLISGFSNAGNADKCLELFEKMKALGLKPTFNTYHPLISMFNKDILDLVEKLVVEMSNIELSLHKEELMGLADDGLKIESWGVEKSKGRKSEICERRD